MNLKQKYTAISLSIFMFALLFISSSVIALNTTEKDGDYFIQNLELEKLLSLINGLIALGMGIITFLAYRTDGRKRLLYVSAAFFIFAIKSFLVGSELLFNELPFIDPLSIILEFFVVLLFFLGVIRKGD